ncbi:MAG: hypothetical protein WDN31_18690 [Hyphomicrobium sp.]
MLERSGLPTFYPLVATPCYGGALIYEPTPRGWMLYGISVLPTPVSAQAAAAPQRTAQALPTFATQVQKAK